MEMERKEFSSETVEIAWEHAKGKCENCGKKLVYENKGREKDDYWEAHHKNGNNQDNSLANCQILCFVCHSRTRTFGNGNRIDVRDILR